MDRLMVFGAFSARVTQHNRTIVQLGVHLPLAVELARVRPHGRERKPPASPVAPAASARTRLTAGKRD
jgi:hypothetical protein